LIANKINKSNLITNGIPVSSSTFEGTHTTYPMFSFWERESFFHSPDVIVLGSGIVGLNAAIHLKQISPSLRVSVAERGFLPYGASTRNAGFACFGSASELIADLDMQSEDTVVQLIEKRWNGLQRLRRLIGDDNLRYEPLGGYEIFTPSDQSTFERCLDKLTYLNNIAGSVTGKQNVFSIKDDDISRLGFRGVSHMLLNNQEGQLDTGAMMQALLARAQQAGVEVYTGVTVTEVLHEEDGIVLLTQNGFRLPCRQLLVATNGFAKSLYPELAVEPARAQVLITHPIPGLKLRGSFHYDEGYYYFRNVGDRILFGGGRNLDFDGEQTTSMQLTETIQHRLEQLLQELICPYTETTIDMRWSGIMGMGTTKTAILERINPRTVCAVRMGGMGVAIGGLIGEEAAELILKGL
jgi:glycine/D-amino acid oxidase-like deaminating enzyme